MRIKNESFLPFGPFQLKFLGRSGVVSEIKGNKVQVIFADNERKEWVKREALLERGFLNK